MSCLYITVIALEMWKHLLELFTNKNYILVLLQPNNCSIYVRCSQLCGTMRDIFLFIYLFITHPTQHHLAPTTGWIGIKKNCSDSDVGGKTSMGENPRNQVETENPIHMINVNKSTKFNHWFDPDPIHRHDDNHVVKEAGNRKLISTRR